MESAALVLATLAVVIILQIITIALVTRKKPSRSQSGPRPNYNPSGERNEKRDYDNRRNNNNNNRRSFQDNRAKQPQQAPKEPSSIDPVEKSLRDINLKLKNAERDQEQARRKVQEFTKDNNNSNRNENGNRSDRHDRGNRRNNRDRNDNRNQRRGNYQDRQNREAPRASETPATPPAEIAEPVNMEQQIIPTVTEPAVENNAPVTTPELVATDVGVSDDNLQHGRRFAVKRRQLKSEDGSESSESTESEELNKNEVEAEVEARPAEEIRFGRR